MSDIITALIGGLCVAIPSIVTSIMTNNSNRRLIEYRIDELQKQVEKHNSIVERTYLLENEQKTMWKRIDEIKRELDHHE